MEVCAWIDALSTQNSFATQRVFGVHRNGSFPRDAWFGLTGC